jgi:rod shape determining protein RodA
MTFLTRFRHIDWLLLFALFPILGAGLSTMYSFTGSNQYFDRQLIWIAVSLLLMFILSVVDFRFLRKTHVVVALFVVFSGLLALLFLVGSVFKGAKGWFDLGFFAVQPADPMKLIVVLTLAKYFSRRHVEIARIKHVIVSGFYAAVPFLKEVFLFYCLFFHTHN